VQGQREGGGGNVLVAKLGFKKSILLKRLKNGQV